MQINESVNATNFLAVGINTSQKGNAENGTPGSDFASFLKSTEVQKSGGKDSISAEKELFPERENPNLKRKGDSSVSKTGGRSDNKNVSDHKNSHRTDNVDGNANNLSGNMVSEGEETIHNDDLGNAISELNDNAVDMIESDIELPDEVIEVISNIVQMLVNNLDVSIEDIQTSLDQLGMEPGDLLTEDGAKAYFLDVQSADVSDLLTDEDMANDLQNLLSEINEIIESQDSLPEDIIKSAKEHNVSFDDVKLYNSDDNIAQNDNIISYDALDDSDNLQDGYIDNISSNQESDINVIVNNTDNSHKDNSETDEKKSSHDQAGINKDITNPIIQGINDAVAQVEEVVPATETPIQQSNIVEQIVEQVRININQENTSMEMQLYPEHLGRIQIHVVSKDGVMTARIAAETEAAKQAIEAGLSNLRESFNNQNLKVEAIEVMVSTTGFADGDQSRDQYQQQGAGKRNNSGGIGFSDIDDDIDDEAENQKMQAEGSSVSYRA